MLFSSFVIAAKYCRQRDREVVMIIRLLALTVALGSLLGLLGVQVWWHRSDSSLSCVQIVHYATLVQNNPEFPIGYKCS